MGYPRSYFHGIYYGKMSEDVPKEKLEPFDRLFELWAEMQDNLSRQLKLLDKMRLKRFDTSW
jgi:hypothetical protein